MVGTKLTGNSKIINIHVVVSKNTVQYFDYLIYNYRHCATNLERLFFFCYALDSESYGIFRNKSDLSLTVPVYDAPGAYRKKTLEDWRVYLRAKLTGQHLLGGSNGHAAGLNVASKIMQNIGGINVVADVDTAMIRHGWDTEICRLLEEFDLIGAPYEGVGGFSSGNSKVQTYKRFPTAVWVALSDRGDWSGMNWWPLKGRNIPIDTEELSFLYNLDQGYEVVRDVGWELPGYAAKHEYRHLAFDHVKPSSDRCDVIRTGHDYNEEYQLNDGGFVAHQRGGSRHPFRSCDLSVRFFDCVEARVGRPRTPHGEQKHQKKYHFLPSS